MPVGALVFATQDERITADASFTLASDLTAFIGERNVADWCAPIRKFEDDDKDQLPSGLPLAKTILEVNLITPYYNIDYERGFFPLIAASFEFLRYRLSSPRIWYGDDSSGRVVEVTEKYLEDLWHYWAENGTRPYDQR